MWIRNIYFFVGGLVYKQLKEESQRIIKKVNVYVQNVMIPLERKPNLLKTNEEKELLIVNKRTVTIFSVCLVVIAIVSRSSLVAAPIAII